MLKLAMILGMAGLASAQIDVKHLSINLVYDSNNEKPDTRPTTWGQVGYVDIPVKFINVPKNKKVKLIRWDGDFYGFIHSVPNTPIPPGSHAGVMFGLITDAIPISSPDVDPVMQASTSVPVWVCDSVAAENTKFRVPLNVQFSPEIYLDPTNTLTVRLAVFLNDTGLPVHMEITGILQFAYVN